MKTTIELPDDLVRQIKLRAVSESRNLKDVIAELLTAAISPPPAATGPESSQVTAKCLPLMKVRPAQPTDVSTVTAQEWCEWIKDVDLQLEVERYEKALGHQHLDRADP